MILLFYSMRELDFEQLMSVYEEGNIMNGARLYPDESAMAQKQLAEQDFADYLRHSFFCQKEAAYYILADNAQYIAAARMEPFEDGYLLSALETRPGYRRNGYGRELVNNLVSVCSERGLLPIYSHVANTNIASINLHLQCGFRVHKDSARYLDGSVRTDSRTFIYEK